MDGRRFVEGFDAGIPDPGRLGGKGASLSRLVLSGHRVPPGFVVAVEAFRATVHHLRLDGALADLSAALRDRGDVLAPGESLARGLLEGRIPSHVLEPIEDAVNRLALFVDNTEGVIVRSSATVEDSSAHSFAGMFESIPILSRDELEPVIRQVWASAFTARALSYARDTGLVEAPAMAVVVQRFLEAWRSGVMFTRFPDPSGQPRVLVEHVEGGCEKLVKGEVTPERLWMEIGEGGPDMLEGPLPAAHARALAQLAARLETLFGGPQDVEWVIHGDRLHVVQSRPITAAFTGDRARPAVEVEGLTPILTGVGASPGAGSGPVHLVFNIDQALALERGQVLVTPMTNPDMVVAMRNAAGIVTDVGGMICHAAIVSRELGLPCVVGTATATSTLTARSPVTVDGSGGAVYEGVISLADEAPSGRAVEWTDIWDMWSEETAGRPDLVPIVSTIAALAKAPEPTAEVALTPDLDLRCDPSGLWADLEGLPTAERAAVLDRFVERVAQVARDRSIGRVHLLPLGGLPGDALTDAIRRSGERRIRMLDDSDVAGGGLRVVRAPSDRWPEGRAAVPLSAAARLRPPASASADGPATGSARVGGVDKAVAAALDTIKFFGHRPGVKVTAMPDPAARERWWAHLPEYGRYHREFGTTGETGSFEWLEVRPELVISALLKSLVQPGFEMVPRVLGFRDVPPMHIKWIRCRYHFRSDVFAMVWASIVRATWDQTAMADMMRRVRASYEHLREVLVLFPQTDQDLAAVDGPRMVAAITAWWPRWVEFFALCWFIQAQGDDIAYPFVEETVADNLAWLGAPPAGLAWPGGADFIAPTTPVMSGEYMADVGILREHLLGAGLRSTDEAVASLDRGDHPNTAKQLQTHLARWGWMRDRDLLFEPWDTPRRVIETALRTEPHAVLPYAENLRRQMVSLGFHSDLAMATDRAAGLNHATRFLHDLNVERENHHILWLKYSYPLRRLCLEIERRLVDVGSLATGDIFFLQAPELIEAAGRLPQPLPDDLVARVKNRRAGFLHEARLAPRGAPPAEEEDDYY